MTFSEVSYCEKGSRQYDNNCTDYFEWNKNVGCKTDFCPFVDSNQYDTSNFKNITNPSTKEKLPHCCDNNTAQNDYCYHNAGWCDSEQDAYLPWGMNYQPIPIQIDQTSIATGFGLSAKNTGYCNAGGIFPKNSYCDPNTCSVNSSNNRWMPIGYCISPSDPASKTCESLYGRKTIDSAYVSEGNVGNIICGQFINPNDTAIRNPVCDNKKYGACKML